MRIADRALLIACVVMVAGCLFVTLKVNNSVNAWLPEINGSMNEVSFQLKDISINIQKIQSDIAMIHGEIKAIRMELKGVMSPQKRALSGISPYLPTGKAAQAVDLGSEQGIKRATEALTPNNRK